MGRLNVHLFGPFQVTLDGEPVTGFHSDKVRALLAYLCTETAGPHRREKLAGLLWPDWPESSARGSLRRALANLRSVISDQTATPPFLSITPQAIEFNTGSDAWVDVATIASLTGDGDRAASLDPADLEQAVTLYHGEFLEGFSLPDSPLFEEWAIFNRERWHRLVLEALQRLVRHHQQSGEYDRGLVHAWRQVELDPWREEAHYELMLLLAASGQRSAALAQFEACRQVLAQELDTEPSAAFQATYELLLKGEPLPDAILAGDRRRPRQVGPCPYLGLAAFCEQDAPFFYGREGFTQRLVEAVQRQPWVAVVVGSSGCGKSSAVFAGLLPRLRDTGHWLITDFRPGAEPFQAVASALLPFLSPQLDEVESLLQARRMADALLTGDFPLADAVALALDRHPDARRLLLVVDQFEELYTLCPDPQQRRRLIDTLLGAVGSTGGPPLPPLVLLLTLRADFMGQALAYRPFADALQEATVMLGPMNRDELRAAIEEPARAQGAAFESGLVERILDDVGDEPGNLPLLEFALTLLWERHHHGWLTHEGYKAIGRVEGALARHADEVYARLDEAEQEGARHVLLQLVCPGEGTEDTRRVATRAEIGEENWGVVQHLADRRLVVTGRDPAGVETVEVVHEALIQSWGQLGAWMEEDRAFRTWQERLRAALRQWELTEQDEGALLRGTPLAEAEGWLDERGDELSEGERSFIRAGGALRARREVEREAQRQRELEAAQALATEQEKRADVEQRRAQEQAESAGRLRRRALLLVGAMVVAALLAAVALLAFRQANLAASAAPAASTQAVAGQSAAETAQALEADQRAMAEAEGWARATQQAVAEAEAQARATQQAVAETEAQARATQQAIAEGQTRLATSRELASAAIAGLDEDPERSVLLALEALSASDTLEARNALRRALPELRALRTLPVPMQALGVAFSPDGRLLAASGWGEPAGVVVWDAASGEELFWLQHPHAGVTRVAFSPDGTRLFESTETDLYGWEIAAISTGAITATNPFSLTGYMANASSWYDIGVCEMSFSPDGKRMAVAHWKGAPTVFDLATMTEVLRLEGHPINSRGIDYSPDGRLLATTSDDDRVRVWDARTGQELLDLGGLKAPMASVDFGPDGSRLASADWHGTMMVWDAANGEELLTVPTDLGFFFHVHFTPAGRGLVTPMSDSTVRVWDAQSGALSRTYAGHTAAVYNAATSPDGSQLASAGIDGTVKIWTTAPVGELLAFSLGPGAGGWGIDYSPDGLQVAVGNMAGPASVWDSVTGERLFSLPEVDEGAGTYAVAYSPDGAQLAVGTGNGLVQIWDTASQELVRTLSGHVGIVSSMGFSPHGRHLATAGNDGMAAVWDLASGQATILTQEEPFIYGIAFSPDGSRVATTAPMNEAAAEEIGVFEWDASTGEKLRMFPVDTLTVYSVAYSPDGELLAAGVQEGNTLIWDTASAELVQMLTGHTGLVFGLAFGPDGRRLASASFDNTVKLWNLATKQELATLYSQTGLPQGIAYSPDGTRIATAAGDGTVRIYVTDTDELVALARSRVTRSLTTEECQKYLHLEACPVRP